MIERQLAHVRALKSIGPTRRPVAPEDLLMY